MLQACLNGGRGSPAPATAETCAEAARAACAAGAACLHIHPRDAAGEETLAPQYVGVWLQAMRDAVPGVPVGLGTGAWIAPGGRARHKEMEQWSDLPDYVSINLGEEDAPDVMDLMDQRGVGIEAGIWSVADAERFVDLNRPVLRILVEVPDVPSKEAGPLADAICKVLEGQDAPILLHGEDRSAWGMIERAAQQGFDTRVGMEDVMVLPDGTAATDNAELVRAARAILENAG